MRPDRGGVKPERSGRTTKCMVDLDTGPWYSIAEPGGGLRSYLELELRNTVEGGAMPTKRVVTRAFILSALAVAPLAGAAGAPEVGPAQSEAGGVQVLGVSTDPSRALGGWLKAQSSKHLLLSGVRRRMLPAGGALPTNDASNIYRSAQRALFIIDQTGTVKFVKV